MHRSIVALGLLTLAAPARADVLQLVSDLDNTLYENPAGSTSNGVGDFIFVGNTATGSIRRALVHFDLAGGLPAGSTITAVTFQLQVSQTNAGPRQVDMHRVTADWGEGASNAPGGEGGGTAAQSGDATWLHRFFSSSFWSQAGGDYGLAISASTSVAGNGSYTWSSPALVSDAQDMLDHPAGNHGWLLKQPIENQSATAKRFNSRENPSASSRPTLIVQFTPPPACSPVSFCSSTPDSSGGAAQMSILGSCSVAANNFTLAASTVPNTIGIFFYSAGQTNGGAGIPFGNGLRCIGSAGNPIFRLPPQATSVHLLTHTLDFNSLTPSGQILPGSIWNFQAWFRDPQAGGAPFDLSDGVQVTFQP